MARGGRQGGWGVVGMNLAGEAFRTTCRLGDGRRSLGGDVALCRSGSDRWN
jgi:hypothetical protein